MTVETDVEHGLTQLLTQIEDECIRLEARYHEAEADWQAKLDERATVDRTLELYRQRHKLRPSMPEVDESLRSRLAGKTIREMIVELAREKDPPSFHVVDMTKRLVRAGMFENTQKAAEGIYSTLGRNKNTFAKLGQGYYLVRSPSQLTKETRDLIQKAPEGKVSTRIQAILGENPGISRDQIVELLEQEGWDFKGKNPTNTVGAAIMFLNRMARPEERQPETYSPLIAF